MTTNAIDHILVEHNPGETRAVAIGTDGRPWHLFWQRWDGLRQSVRRGQIIEARIRSKDDHGNAFLDHLGDPLWIGGPESVFMDKQYAGDHHEGEAIKCRVSAAARQDHAAKTVPCDPSLPISQPGDALEIWKGSFSRAPMSPARTLVGASDTLSSAFEEALLVSLTLPKGGAIHIERTRALTAVDVDSGGRTSKGSAGARALSLNREAVIETARQLSLRGLGGAVVIDCVEPLNRNSNDKLKDALLQSYQSIEGGPVQVIAPSRLGLMQVAIPWHDTPWGEVADSAETKLLSALREAQRQLESDTGSFYTLELCPFAHEAYLMRKDVVDKTVQDCFHGRLILEKAMPNQEGLKRR